MKHKFFLSFFFVFLLLVSTVSAVTFESGVNFSYDNITATFSENTSMDNFITYATGFTFGDHNISLYSDGDTNLTVSSWSESSNSFILQSESNIYFDIRVAGVSQYVYYDNVLAISPFLASGSKSFFYQSTLIPVVSTSDDVLDEDILSLKQTFLIAVGLVGLIIIGFMVPDIIKLLRFKNVDQGSINKRLYALFIMLLVIIAVTGIAFFLLDMLAAA